MSSNKSDIKRNAWMLKGSLAKKGYDWWWHSFTGINSETQEEKAFFFEAFTVNPKRNKGECVLGQDPKTKEQGLLPSYLMIKCGAWGHDAVQLHKFYGFKDVNINYNVPFKVETKDHTCMVAENESYGQVVITPEEATAHPEWMCGSGSMEWHVKMKKEIAFNVGYGASKLFRDLALFEMFWHAEGIKTLYEGYVMLNGVKYDIIPESSYGYQDKNWGHDFTSPWVWLSSNHLISNITGQELKHSAFEIGGGAPKVAFIRLKRKLLGNFIYEGDDIEFNFSKFWTGSKTIFNCFETKDKIVWHVEQTTHSHKLITDITCLKDDMLLVNYENPLGLKKHNHLFNGGNGEGNLKLYKKVKGEWQLIDDIHALNIGCEYGEYNL